MKDHLFQMFKDDKCYVALIADTSYLFSVSPAVYSKC